LEGKFYSFLLIVGALFYFFIASLLEFYLPPNIILSFSEHLALGIAIGGGVALIVWEFIDVHDEIDELKEEVSKLKNELECLRN